MTLRDLFELLAANPVYVIAYFALIPLTALIAAFMGRGEGHLSPWKYLYACLIYLVCVPGIFSISLSIYLFMFERGSIFSMDLFTQVLPVLSMIVTLLLIRRNVDLDLVPGFGRISALMMMIAVVILLMWIIDKTRIFVISFWPFHYVLILFVVLFLVFRLAMGRFFASGGRS
ncbi:MAG: hypothetical protein AAFP19_12345 [Bacteroidota bacterium]